MVIGQITFLQIKQVCTMLQNDPNFHNGYNAIGLSQGGLFAWVINKAKKLQLLILITLGEA